MNGTMRTIQLAVAALALALLLGGIAANRAEAKDSNMLANGLGTVATRLGGNRAGWLPMFRGRSLLGTPEAPTRNVSWHGVESDPNRGALRDNRPLPRTYRRREVSRCSGNTRC